MKKSRFTEAQIIGVLRGPMAGGPTYCQTHQSRPPFSTDSRHDWIRSGVEVSRYSGRKAPPEASSGLF